MSKYALAHRRSLAVVAAAAVLALTAGGGAVAGSLITSKDIQDKTITGADLHKNAVKTQKVKDGTLKIQDLNKKAQDLINQPGPAGKDGKDADMSKVTALETRLAALEKRVATLEAQDASGVNTNWVAGQGSTIVDAHTVRLVLAAGNPAGTSVEIQNLDLPVQATKTVSFTYKLENGAAYSAGAPRVFIEIGAPSTTPSTPIPPTPAPTTATAPSPRPGPSRPTVGSAPPASSTTTLLRSERSP